MRTWKAGNQLRRDDGSLSVYFVSAMLAVIPLVGLVVDGTGQIRAQQEADLVAEQAARSAGQEIELGNAILGDAVFVDSGAVRHAADTFAAAQGDYEVTSVEVSGDRHVVTVRLSTTYDPLLLDAIGLGPSTLEGEGTAYTHQTRDGDEYERPSD